MKKILQTIFPGMLLYQCERENSQFRVIVLIWIKIAFLLYKVWMHSKDFFSKDATLLKTICPLSLGDSLAPWEIAVDKLFN